MSLSWITPEALQLSQKDIRLIREQKKYRNERRFVWLLYWQMRMFINGMCNSRYDGYANRNNKDCLLILI